LVGLLVEELGEDVEELVGAPGLLSQGLLHAHHQLIEEGVLEVGVVRAEEFDDLFGVLADLLGALEDQTLDQPVALSTQ